VNPIHNSKNLSHHLDKIVFAIACFYLVAVLLWLFSQNKLRVPSLAEYPHPTVPQNNHILSSDLQFIDYFQRSLAAIDRSAVYQGEPQPSLPSFPLRQPTPSIPNPPPLATPPPAKVIEKVYIPVYPPNPISTPLAPGKISVPAPAPLRASQKAFPPTTVPVLTPGDRLLPSLKGSQTLIGLLESGDRSAALFNINGIAQQIKIGEGISTTGWTLIAVENQKALIHRNGDRRWVDVGQKF
jgi:hypothetical protein